MAAVALSGLSFVFFITVACVFGVTYIAAPCMLLNIFSRKLFHNVGHAAFSTWFRLVPVSLSTLLGVVRIFSPY